MLFTKECYFDIEIAFTDDETVEKMRRGERVPMSDRMKIITAQYQFFDEIGKPIGPVRILKEWTSSEESIIRKISAIINPSLVWEVIPVGCNLYFDLGILRRRAAVYGINYSEQFIYHELPVIDVKHICIGMNNFRFKNSGLDKFTSKKMSGAMVPVWYHDKDYDKIIDYINNEFEAFAVFYQKLKEKMPVFGKEMQSGDERQEAGNDT